MNLVGNRLAELCITSTKSIIVLEKPQLEMAKKPVSDVKKKQFVACAFSFLYGAFRVNSIKPDEIANSS